MRFNTKDITYDKTIVFCVVGESLSHNFLRSWTEIVGYCLLNNIKPILSSHRHNTFVSKSYVLSPDIETNSPFSGNVDYDYIIYIKKVFHCSDPFSSLFLFGDQPPY